MKLIHSSVAAKIFASFASVLLVVIVLGIVSINRLGVVNDHAADVRDNWLPSLALQGRMLFNVTQMRADESKLLIKSSNVNVGDLEARVQKARDTINQQAKTYEPMIV